VCHPASGKVEAKRVESVSKTISHALVSAELADPKSGKVVETNTGLYSPAGGGLGGAYDPASGESADLDSSDSYGDFYRGAMKKGYNDLLNAPQFQPGSPQREFTSMMVSFTPVGMALDLYAAIKGRDPVSGRKLPGWERGLRAMGPVLGALGHAAEGLSHARAPRGGAALLHEAEEGIAAERNFVSRSGKYRSIDYSGTVKVDGVERDVSRRVFQNSDIDWEQIHPESGLSNK
jgi:Pre-toxin TG